MEAIKDTRTLIRNVLPGLAIILEFLFFAWLSGLLETEPAKNARKFLVDKESSAIIIGAVTLFFASGAAGYVVANIYHFILNYLPYFRGLFDYHSVLHSLDASGHLEVYGLDENQIKFDRRKCWCGWVRRRGQDTRRDWAIVTAIWAERSTTNKQIKGATDRAESLCNVAHGAGTLFVGSFLALLIAFTWPLWSCEPSWYSTQQLGSVVPFLP